jgi:UDP-2,3-diacylglucosamine pyrophosphatase LpxH
LAKLEDYAKTERQREVVCAWENSGRNAARAAASIGITSATLRNIVSNVKGFASAAGYSESWDATAHVPEGEYVTGRSIYLKDDSGNKAWLKTRRKMETAEKEAALKAFVDQLSLIISPVKRVNEKAADKNRSKDLLPTIIIGDAHIGARADESETRERDFDSKIASAEILKAIDYLVEAAPASEEAMLINVGDFMHANSHKNTTANLTPLDVDTRIEKVMRIAAETIIHAITRMLEKHSRISVVMARGNHDSDMAIAISMILGFYYSKELRVTILEPQGFQHYVTFGKNLIAVTHGDKIPSRRLADMLPRLSVWSKTTHRYFILGHFHHKLAETFDNSVIVERFGTLAPADGWHASKGYKSASIMNQIVYRRSGGIAIRHEYEIPGTDYEPDHQI